MHIIPVFGGISGSTNTTLNKTFPLIYTITDTTKPCAYIRNRFTQSEFAIYMGDKIILRMIAQTSAKRAGLFFPDLNLSLSRDWF